MKNKLFKYVNFDNDPHWVVKDFFNSIYQQDKFLWALPLLVEKKGFGINEEFCFFPDLNDPDPIYHFSGVTFGTMDDEVIVSDDQYNKYLKEACERYIEDNPEDRGLVAQVLGETRDSK
jgi:hypothetical protein